MIKETQISRHQYPDAWPAIRDIRQRVFIVEQGVSVEDEWDAADNSAEHFLLSDSDGNPIAAARLIINDNNQYQIGRMAVLKPFRQQGYGRLLMQAMIQRYTELSSACTHPQGLALVLHAQIQALHFYQALGFIAQGEEFIDAGIVHRTMFYSPVRQPHGGLI